VWAPAARLRGIVIGLLKLPSASVTVVPSTVGAE
jgi:hypothetical protein